VIVVGLAQISSLAVLPKGMKTKLASSGCCGGTMRMQGFSG